MLKSDRKDSGEKKEWGKNSSSDKRQPRSLGEGKTHTLEDEEVQRGDAKKSEETWEKEPQTTVSGRSREKKINEVTQSGE